MSSYYPLPPHILFMYAETTLSRKRMANGDFACSQSGPHKLRSTNWVLIEHLTGSDLIVRTIPIRPVRPSVLPVLSVPITCAISMHPHHCRCVRSVPANYCTPRGLSLSSVRKGDQMAAMWKDTTNVTTCARILFEPFWFCCLC